MESPASDGVVDRLLVENQLLRHRADVITDHAHAHAVSVVALRRDLELMQSRDAEVAALQFELDRLRALPEVRLGQRLRHFVPRLRRREPAPVPVQVQEPGDGIGATRTPPVVVIVRDRLACLDELVTWLERNGVTEIHLVDNQSSYPPLIAYLDRSPHRVWRLGTNLGHEAPWIIGLIAELASRGSFVVTDPDVIPHESCPRDVFAHLESLLERYPDVDKVGLGLILDDLPAYAQHRERVVAWERKHWEDEIEPGVYRAPVDTTFALYRAAPMHHILRSIRTGPPYVARHLPWYLDPECLPAEEVYYRERADPSISSWNGDGVSPWIVERLQAAEPANGAVEQS